MHPIILLRHREEFGLALVNVTPLFTALKTQAIVLLQHLQRLQLVLRIPGRCALFGLV